MPITVIKEGETLRLVRSTISLPEGEQIVLHTEEGWRALQMDRKSAIPARHDAVDLRSDSSASALGDAH